jgi:hypothetical protein
LKIALFLICSLGESLLSWFFVGLGVILVSSWSLLGSSWPSTGSQLYFVYSHSHARPIRRSLARHSLGLIHPKTSVRPYSTSCIYSLRMYTISNPFHSNRKNCRPHPANTSTIHHLIQALQKKKDSPVLNRETLRLSPIPPPRPPTADVARVNLTSHNTSERI